MKSLQNGQKRILIGCEFSGVVTEKFRELGHEAYSCDLLPTETNQAYHIQKDVREILNDNWDMGIFFPPCTHLCVSGARWFKDKKKEQQSALDFISRLLLSPIPMICLENPIGVISTKIRKPDQIIQPYQFGHEETKATCLWLKNLPKLKPTKIMNVKNKNLTPSGQNKIPPSKDRWKIRSKTYHGIAQAMANQWGCL